MNYEKKLRIVNIVFAIVILLTLMAVIGFSYYCQQTTTLPYTDIYFGSLVFALIILPVFIAEADLFFNTIYFIRPKEYRGKFKTILNSILSILSVTTIITVITSLIIFDDIQYLIVYWLKL